VWHKLAKQINVEREQLRRLIEIHSRLLANCASETPNDIELSALAALLHSFYTGVENIFKRVAIELDGEAPRGEAWHRQLLDAMVAPAKLRGALISESLRDTLSEYLAFRHVFRQAYSFDLRWDKMSALVLNCETTFRRLETGVGSVLANRAVGLPGKD
jgi:hypothetical protein